MFHHTNKDLVERVMAHIAGSQKMPWFYFRELCLDGEQRGLIEIRGRDEENPPFWWDAGQRVSVTEAGKECAKDRGSIAKGATGEPMKSDFVNFGDMARQRLEMQCQYACRYTGAVKGDGTIDPDYWKGIDGSPCLGEGLRFRGSTKDYHFMEIHKDDVEEFVRRVRGRPDVHLAQQMPDCPTPASQEIFLLPGGRLTT